MKRLSIYLFIFVLLGCGLFFGIRRLMRGETLTTRATCSRWGEEIFDLNKFKNGNELARSKMACSLLKQEKQFIGKNSLEIRNTLGNYDGFYFSGMYPAYMIETATKNEQDSWQIVFLINRKHKIKEIIVHKNCCYKNWLNAM